MPTDETRRRKPLESQHESPRRPKYDPMLESLETQITILLEAVTDDETLEANARSTATRHCRELRAELECIRIALPETATGDRWNGPSGPPNENQDSAADRPKRDDGPTGVATVSDPMEALREATRRRSDRQG